MSDLHTPVCDLLCCDHPVVLAGMGGVARSELVAAVSEAGGFGFLGMVREPPDLIRREIAAVRARTSRPFGVNLIPAATPADLLAAEVEACIEARVHAVTLFWDVAPELVARFREAGVLVACQVGSADEAVAARAAGADLIIAQGVEAGGHVRGQTPLAQLLPQVVAAVDAPVLAAGGVVDGAGLAAALRQGADGVVVGTAFLATAESFAHDFHKQRLMAASGETVRTTDFHINWPAGAYVRVLPNSVTRGERGDPQASPRQVIGREGERPIYLFSTDSPLRSMSGDFEAMALYAGEGAGRIRDIRPAAERLAAIVAGAEVLLAAPRRAVAPTVEPSSPVCYAAEADDAYMGYAGRDELIAELNTLLEAERAGARVAARLAVHAPDAELRRMSRSIQGDEARWCRMLRGVLARLGAEASPRVGGFYDKAMAIDDPRARVAFLNRGQAWVVRRLRALMPRVRDEALYRDLRDMLVAHEDNIAFAQSVLDRGSEVADATPGEAVVVPGAAAAKAEAAQTGAGDAASDQ